MQASVRATASNEVSVGARAALADSLGRIFSGLPNGRGWATYPFNTLTLSSRFQPIFDRAAKQCVAYEALLSATNLTGREMKPETVFAVSATHEEQLFLDWLCRAMHMRNFANMGQARGLLFLNAYPHAAIEDPHHPEVFSRMIEFYGMTPQDVVVEILETGVSDDAQLTDAANLYRSLGCRIAIDDFGVGFSNFDRLWRLAPEFVKIDRSVTAAAVHDPQARRVLENMVKMIRDCGAKVVIEGIEDRTEALLALAVGADYLQGFYFARPGQDPFPEALGEQILNSLADSAAHAVETASLENYSEALVAAVDGLKAGESLAHATAPFLVLSSAVRTYLLSAGETEAPGERLVLDLVEDHDLAPLACTGSAACQLKNILKRTLANPDVVQVTRPLTVVEGAQPTATTVTLSYAFSHGERMLVLCGDVLTAGSSSLSNPAEPGGLAAARKPHLYL